MKLFKYNSNSKVNNTIENLDFYNSTELQLKRKEFALQNTYVKQIQRIEAQLTQPNK